MATVVVINTSNLNTDTDVEVHAPNCQHMKRYMRNPFFHMENPCPDETSEYETLTEIYREYNADFYGEAPDEDPDYGCWPIWVFPCTGMVNRKTVVNKWGDE